MPGALLAFRRFGRGDGRGGFGRFSFIRFFLRGPFWHPLLGVGIVIVVVALIAANRRGSRPSSGPGGRDRMSRDASGRLDIDREMEQRHRDS